MPDPKLIFTAWKKEPGRIKKIKYFESKYLVYDDGQMYYTVRYKYRDRHDWTDWKPAVKRGRIHFAFRAAVDNFKEDGWQIKWKCKSVDVKAARSSLNPTSYG